jgi:carboxyl-terminal processing protease
MPGTIAPPAELKEERMVVSPEHVRRAQDALRARGMAPGQSGKLDEKTQQALQQFQKMNGLPATGLLDEKTAAKLGVDLPSGPK